MNMQRRYILMVFVLVLLGIGLGYASLSTNLNITGTTILKDNRWDIHLENVVVTNGSVSATTPTINTGRDTVTYSVTLNQPGDFYEFKVDAKNDGSIDGMISNISSKLNGSEITTLPTALSYSLTYSDGTEILNNHLLSAGSKATYKLRVGYRTDITAADLPSSEQTLNFSFTVTYVQADDNAIMMNLPDAYTMSYGKVIGINSPLPNNVTSYPTFQAAIDSDYGHNMTLKHSFELNNVSKNYVAFNFENMYYLLPGNDTATYNSNVATLNSAFGSSNCQLLVDEDPEPEECLTPPCEIPITIEHEEGAYLCSRTYGVNFGNHTTNYTFYGYADMDGNVFILDDACTCFIRSRPDEDDIGFLKYYITDYNDYDSAECIVHTSTGTGGF